VELEQLLVVCGERAGAGIGQPLGDGSAQVVAAGLDLLVSFLRTWEWNFGFGSLG
jgi:hypothetical protein